MCGRFVASRPISDIVDIFSVDDVEVPDELTQPRWNVAPQAGVLAVTVGRPKAESAPNEATASGSDDAGRRGNDRTEPRHTTAAAPDGHETAVPGRRRLTSYRWGLIPSWAKDPSFGARAFNARAESLLDKSAFRNAVARRRCLIPADAFYEWEKTGGADSGRPATAGGHGRRPARQPWCYTSATGEPLAFAGLWEAWKARPDGSRRGSSPGPAGPLLPDGEDPAVSGWHDDWLLSCTIITTPANDTVAPVHDRMPLVLDPSEWEAWLQPGALDPDELASLLRTPRVGLLEAYEVSNEVNASSAEGPQLIEPVDKSDEAGARAGDAGEAEAAGAHAGDARSGGAQAAGTHAGGTHPPDTQPTLF